MHTNTDKLLERASKVFPGGVCATVRYSSALKTPLYFQRADGAHITDVQGDELIDMCMSHGASLLGHGHPRVKAAVEKALSLGIMCSFDTPWHVELAEKLTAIIPCAEMIRFTNSGTEATLHALRLCRAVSGKNKIIRFLGHFHGYHEYVYIGGHPPRTALDNPSAYVESSGIPQQMSEYVIAIPGGDLDILSDTLKKHHHEVCALIMEPVNYNNGCIVYSQEFLRGVRKLCSENNVILFFDEIQSSFKKSSGGAQTDFGVVPDICTIGKALGGGLPLSAICGSTDIIKHFKPVGTTQHSGTFNAHPVSILASLAFVEEITGPSFYEALKEMEDYFYPALEKLFMEKRSGFHLQHHGARFGIFSDLGNDPITSYEQTLDHNVNKMLSFYKALYEKKVFFCDYGGKPAHHGISIMHTKEMLSEVLNRIEDVL